MGFQHRVAFLTEIPPFLFRFPPLEQHGFPTAISIPREHPAPSPLSRCSTMVAYLSPKLHVFPPERCGQRTLAWLGLSSFGLLTLRPRPRLFFSRAVSSFSLLGSTPPAQQGKNARQPVQGDDGVIVGYISNGVVSSSEQLDTGASQSEKRREEKSKKKRMRRLKRKKRTEKKEKRKKDR